MAVVHSDRCSIRTGRNDGGDRDFVEEMLLEAFCWESGISGAASRAQLAQDPEFKKWTADWGRFGDRIVVAECGNARVGAGWYRLWSDDVHSYGFVDSATPELGLGVAPRVRARGIGRALMVELIRVAKQDGFVALSLSVDPQNPARRLYESLRFQKIGATGTSWTYLLRLDAQSTGAPATTDGID